MKEKLDKVILSYEFPGLPCNLGDYMQSLAQYNFLNTKNSVNRFKLAELHPTNKTLIILNGWYSHYSLGEVNFPLHKNFIPIYVSIHMTPKLFDKQNSKLLSKFLFEFDNKEIGCRDLFTTEKLKEYGINAYFSGCLTETIGCFSDTNKPRSNKIVIVDDWIANLGECYAKFKPEGYSFDEVKNLKSDSYWDMVLSSYESIIPDFNKLEVDRLRFYPQYVDNYISHLTGLSEAMHLRDAYLSTKYVITSKLHSAIPATSLGAEVFYVNAFDCDERFSGLEYFNRVIFNPKTKEVININKPSADFRFHSIELCYDILQRVKKIESKYIVRED